MKPLRLLAALVLIVGGCIPQMDPEERAHTFIYLRATGPISLDPAVATTSGEFPIEQQLYEQLVALDPAAPGLVRGELARSWHMSPDGRVLEIELASGHRFSSGAEVDAAAVKFSLDRVRRLGRSPSGYLEWVEAVDIIDRLQLRIRLKRPYAPAVQMLAQAAASIVDPAEVAAHDVGDDGVAWLSEHSAGSGPYRLVQISANESALLAVNPFTDRKPARFDRIEFRFLPDEGVRRLLLERGDGDLSDIVSAAFVARYRALPGVQVKLAEAGTSLSFLVLNTRSGPFHDPRLRQAVAAAIDYRGLRVDVLKGNTGQLAGYLTPGSPGYDALEPPPERDLPLARHLVEQSGYAGQPLRMLISQVGPVAEFLQANLLEAGLNVVLERRAPGATEAAKQSGDFDLVYDGWIMDTPDPGGMLEALYATRSLADGTNAAGYSDPEVDRWIDAALADQDEVQCAGLFTEIDQRLRRDRPVVMIFAAEPAIAYRSDITGLELNPLTPFLIPISPLDRAPKP
jgi:peptide/nickel transport system substrate-binding protein